ncbi:MAG: Rpn family recombination-promoting nuclease/putative transposase [Bacteroidales bacterium]|nr:Rpn family recombination-promoting nuclease/putative transposase [Bacteroidales bacterium]
MCTEREKEYVTKLKSRLAYQMSLKRMRDNYNVVNYALEKGLEEGMEKGMEQGREEKTLEIVKKMKAQGFTTQQIAAITGLSLDEISLL